MQITLYMLRRDLEDGEFGLREVAAEYVAVPSQAIGDLETELWIRRSNPKPPKWVKELSGIAAREHLAPLYNVSTAALLRIRYEGHRFILTYGMGHHAVHPAAVQPGFGLRVVANAVSATQLKSADTRGLGRRGRASRTVLPTAGPFYELGIETTEDLVRQLEGKPAADFATLAAGSNSLKLKVSDFSLQHLQQKLDQIIEQYHSAEYKKDFGFIDYFTRVPREDKVLVAELEALLTGNILDHAHGVDFASPDIDAPMSSDHYVIKWGRKQVELADLHPGEISGIVNDWGVEDPLHDVRVFAFGPEGDWPISRYRLLDYAVADVPAGSRRYTICAGEWYEVDADNLAAIQRSIEAIPDVTDALKLAPWDANLGDEDHYNASVAKQRQWVLLDRTSFPGGGAHQKIEVCDVLTEDRKLICVKKMQDSATLSHLFAQGTVSAELLTSDFNNYRARVVEYLKQLRNDAKFGNREDWTVVYAIATNKPGKLTDSLFFFSKVNLDRAARTLRSIGVGIALARIEFTPKQK